MEFVAIALLALGGTWLAWRLAPVSTVVAALALAVLVGSGAIDSDRLPLAGKVSSAAASVERWQAGQARKGACYIRGTAALQSGDKAALDAVAADCPPR